MRNPRYKNSDLKLYIQKPFDWDLLVPCGKCVECRKVEARNWRARLLIEVEYWTRQNKRCDFITFTISDDYYDEFALDPKKPIRLFLENYRRIVGKSLKHFIVTELGGKTGRLHYHGIFFGSELSVEKLKQLWRYGFSFFGYCSYRTARYVAKYILKPQLYADWYKPRKYVSPGLGKSYLLKDFAKSQSANPDPKSMFVYIDGYKYSMPRYLRDKVYTEEFLRSLKYDRYYHVLDLLERQNSLKVGNTTFLSVDDYLRVREDVYRDSLVRGMSTFPSCPKNYLSDILPSQEFNFVNWDHGLDSETPF